MMGPSPVTLRMPCPDESPMTTVELHHGRGSRSELGRSAGQRSKARCESHFAKHWKELDIPIVPNLDAQTIQKYLLV